MTYTTLLTKTDTFKNLPNRSTGYAEICSVICLSGNLSDIDA